MNETIRGIQRAIDQEEMAALRHDIGRYVNIAAKQAQELEELRADLAAARALLREARAYVVSDHGWSYVYPTGWLADRIDAALAQGEK